MRVGDQCEATGSCTFTGTECVGTPTPCSELSDEVCPDEPGCIVSAMEVCRGTPVACATLTRAACPSQPGCSIDPMPDGGMPDGGIPEIDGGVVDVDGGEPEVDSGP
jgi:hypothetical protein